MKMENEAFNGASNGRFEMGDETGSEAAKENRMNVNNVIRKLEAEIVALKTENKRLRKQNETLTAQMQIGDEVLTGSPLSPPENSDHDQVFVVSRIIKHKLINNARQFRVRWEGYGAKDDTWEPEHNLKDVIIFKNYFRKHFK